MTRESDLCSLRQLYALDGLSDDERREFEAHLTECPDCQAELDKDISVAEWLLYDFDDVAPPAEMKHRVLTAVFADEAAEEPNQPPAESVVPTPVTILNSSANGAVRKGRLWNRPWMVTWVAAALLIAAGIGYGIHRGTSSPSFLPLQSSVPGATALVATTDVEGQKSLLMKFSGLQPVKNTEVYQVWLIQTGHAPVSAGVFLPNASGEQVFQALLPPDHYQVVAVTLEPKAIDQQPLGTKVFAGTLS